MSVANSENKHISVIGDGAISAGMAFEALKDGIKQKDFRYVKLFHEYRYGKPKETKDINLDQDVPFIIEMD